MADSSSPEVRVGVGGWTYAPWRDNFFPKGLPHAQELAWASRQLSAIEVNGTYYSTMKPESFRKWHAETPEDFVFSLKASRFATNRKLLATAGDSIARFVDSGIAELGDKLGPIVWQFMPSKAFDPPDFEAFLALLPKAVGSRALRHVVDLRHPSFFTPALRELVGRYRVSVVHTDPADFPCFDAPVGELAYARLMRSEARLKAGYAPKALDDWAARARSWTQASEAGPARSAFVFFISGAKEKAPAAAGALLQRLGWTPPAPA